jgi:hypothetical protein
MWTVADIYISLSSTIYNETTHSVQCSSHFGQCVKLWRGAQRSVDKILPAGEAV